MFGLDFTHLPWLVKGAIGPLFYLGPETIMPLASILAAIVGFLLIFWRAIVKGIKKVFGKDQALNDVTEYVEPEDDDIKSDQV